MINFYEFIGILIGDGCIHYHTKHAIYGVEITGNPVEESDYYVEISKFMESYFQKKTRIFVKEEKKGSGLRLVAYSKKIADYLIAVGITPHKTYTVRI